MPSLATDRPRLFISHQWRDKQVAERLAGDLEEFAEVWIDYRGLRPGDPIQATIDRALEEVDAMLVVWTENARRSDGVRKEIERCVATGVRLIPCIFEYDAQGRPHPPLEPPLDGLLGIDFHHRGNGLAQISELVLHMQTTRLAGGVPNESDPGHRLLRYLRGYLNYLAGYRSLHGVQDRRGEWVDRIIGEIEQYARAGGDVAAVRALLAAARVSQVDDAEGIGMLVTRLSALLGEDDVADPGESMRAKQPSEDGDALTRAITVAAAREPGVPWERGVDTYLANAEPALRALADYAEAARSPAGAQVVAFLRHYLEEPHDLVADSQGRLGRADDAWLILNTAYRLIESGVVPITILPVDWPTVIRVDPLIREALPAGVLERLTGMVFEMLQMIAVEVASYQPWFTPQGRGYSPTMPPSGQGGGTWEDQMNTMLLGTGLSVDG